MPYKVLIEIKYGKEGQSFTLKPGDIIGDRFMLKRDRKQMLEINAIEKTREDPTIDPEGVPIETLADLQEMNVAEVRAFLENEYDVAKLEKYVDQENRAKERRRKTVIIFLQKKISELTGYEYPRNLD